MPAASARLLVVEDDVAMLMLLEEILEAEDYEVFTARDGIEAIEVLRTCPLPDLIISDVMMPRMDGFELLRRVRSNDAWINTPFLFLTARTETKDIVQGKTLGADDYISKPFDYEEFLTLVEARLNRSRAIAESQSNKTTDLKRQILMLLNHEFRTPLTLIVAYANMLKDYNGHTAMSHEELMEFLQNISSGAQRLRRLVENFILLVELSYPEHMGIDYHWRMRRIDEPGGLLRDALDSVTRDLQSHQFEFEVDPGVPSFIGDRDSLVIALRELIDNAIKFSQPGKTVTISAFLKDGWLHLRVKDEGQGIPDDELDKIGAAFYQIERGTTEHQGAGAGLAIVGTIAKLHHGRVNVDSVPGRYAMFELILPLDPEQVRTR